MSADPVVPVTEINQLRQECRRWQARCVAAAVGLAILAVVALIQFSGTFITCRLLDDARRETAALHRKNVATLGEMHAARLALQTTVERVTERMLAEQFEASREQTARDVEAQVRRLIEQLSVKQELEAQRQQVADLNQDVTRLGSEIHDLLHHQDAVRENLKRCPPTVAPHPGVAVPPK